MDELRIGTTFADVIPLAMPEPSTIVLLAMSAVCCALRRQKVKTGN